MLPPPPGGPQINAWFIAARNPETGEYPDFPEASDGGSKPILNPPLPTIEQLLAEEAPADGKGEQTIKSVLPVAGPLVNPHLWLDRSFVVCPWRRRGPLHLDPSLVLSPGG